jgi:hypothetical protein
MALADQNTSYRKKNGNDIDHIHVQSRLDLNMMTALETSTTIWRPGSRRLGIVVETLQGRFVTVKL